MKAFFRFITSRVFLINLAIAIVLMLGGLYLVHRTLNNYTLHGEKIAVPRLTGRTIPEVDSLLKAEGMRYTIVDSIYSEELLPGEVVMQNPEAFQNVKEGRRIYLTINSFQPPFVELPELRNLSLRQAMTTMEVLGFQLNKLEYKPDICVDCVLEVKRDDKVLSPGDPLQKGTHLTLVLGQGMTEGKASVPYLVGMPLGEAVRVLLERSLNLGAVNYSRCGSKSDSSMVARVLKQSPEFGPNAEAPMGAEVDLWLTCDTASIIVIDVDSLMRELRMDNEEPSFNDVEEGL